MLKPENNIQIHLVGGGRNKEYLVKQSAEYNLGNIVVFHDSIPEYMVPSYLNSCDVAILSLKANPIFDDTIPAKLQTYMACGMPILGVCSGESKKLIENSNSGKTTENLTPENIAKLLMDFSKSSDKEMKDYALNSFNYNEKNFKKDILIQKLERYLKGEYYV